jgi:hypothetical protein
MKKMKRMGLFSLKVAGLCLGVLLAGLPPAWAAPGLTVSPAAVQIGTFFHGQTVKIAATIPAGAQAVLEVIGTNADEHLMRKGRRGGLWMNVGEIVVHDAPSLYLVMSTSKELLSSAPPDATWGYQALKKDIRLTGRIETGEQEEFLGQFFQLKESDQVYATFPGALKISAAGEESKLEAAFPLPTNTKPGTYKVCLSVIKDGLVVDRPCTNLTVEMVGFPALLASLAYQHGATYGVVAVVIAIITGFAMGFLFKGGGGH